MQEIPKNTYEKTEDRYKPELDALQKFFRRPSFLSLTIGLPFCVFKLLFGITALGVGFGSDPIIASVGLVIVVWAGADLLMNAGRVIFDLLNRPAAFEYCTIAQLGRFAGRPMVFLAVDTLLAFCIICAMLWSGWITHLDTVQQYLWYAATTLNLVSLSLVSLYNEIRAA
jgi:hypothetical protein